MVHSSTLTELPETQELIHYFCLQLLMWCENIFCLRAANTGILLKFVLRDSQEREVDGAYNLMYYVITCIPDREFLLLFCFNYILMGCDLHLQFYMLGDWKNFPDSGF